jgi:hypothetical protein
MYSKFSLLFVFLAIVSLLNGCENAKQALGQTKVSPDEFAVFQRAPLSLPPDYGLKPPRPGSERPQAVNPRDRAAKALGLKRKAPGQPANTKGRLSSLSRGERSVLQMTGATKADPEIRMKIEKETGIMVTASKSFTDKITFWQNPNKFGITVDPAKEAKRIQKNQALGKPLNKGDVPVIKRKTKAIFEDVFK